MFFIGVVVALLFILFLGLTLMRLFDDRPVANATFLADLMNTVCADTDKEKNKSKKSGLPHIVLRTI